MNVPRDSRLSAPQLKRYNPVSAARSVYEGLYLSRIAVHASPALVKLESSIRRRQQSSRLVNVDMAATDKEAAGAFVLRVDTNGSSNQGLPATVQRSKHKRSYLQPTESFLRQSTIDSDAGSPAAVLHMRRRDNKGGDFMSDGDDSESVAISRWPLVRRGVRRREWKNASLVNNGGRRKASQPLVVTETSLKKRPQPCTLFKREGVATGSPAWSASLSLTNGADAANGVGRRSDHSTALRTAANGNGVVRGGVRVTGSRSTSLGVGSKGCPFQQRPGDAVAALQESSPLPNTAATFDDSSSEFSKFAVSVSLSPMTTGSRSCGKSLQVQQQWRSTCECPGSNASADLADLLDYGPSIDFQEGSCTLDEYEASQPVDLDQLTSLPFRVPSSGTVVPSEGRLLPWTLRSEPSPWVEHQRPSNRSLDPDAPILVTKLFRSTEGPGGGSAPQPLQRCELSIGSKVPTPEASLASSTTATHQVSNISRFTPGCEMGRKSADSGSIINTPFSAQWERASYETERNASRAPSRPYVPRLALDELNAKRELQRSTGAASYKVAPDSFSASAFCRDTSTMGSSDMSDVTVSSMTVTPSQGARSGLIFTSEGPGSFDVEGRTDHAGTKRNVPFEDVRVEPNPSMNFENRHCSATADDSTHGSNASTSARDGLCGSVAVETRGAGKAHHGVQDLKAASSSVEAPLANASQDLRRNSGGLTMALRTAGCENDTTHSSAGASHYRRGPPKPGKPRSEGLRPPSPITKKNVKCCVVM